MGQGRSSHTALRISLSLPLVAQDRELRGLLPEGAARATVRLLHGAGLLQAPTLEAFGRSGRARFALAFERRFTPGQLLYLGLRKRFVDDEVRAALETGATQVLVVGAGFDTLALRLSGPNPAVNFVEIDRPSTVERKRVGARALGGCPPNLHLLAVDLTSESLPEVLGGLAGWNPGRLSVVVAEGLLMYLDEAAVLGFLGAVHRCSGPGSVLVFSYLRPDRKGRPYMGKIGPLLRASLRSIGEPLQWAIRDQDLPAFLEKLGFGMDVAAARCDLRRRYLEPAGLGERPLGSIEGLALAERIERRAEGPARAPRAEEL